jgi:predicted transposase/invertase (TIGR01784 family)
MDKAGVMTKLNQRRKGQGRFPAAQTFADQSHQQRPPALAPPGKQVPKRRGKGAQRVLPRFIRHARKDRFNPSRPGSYRQPAFKRRFNFFQPPGILLIHISLSIQDKYGGLQETRFLDSQGKKRGIPELVQTLNNHYTQNMRQANLLLEKTNPRLNPLNDYLFLKVMGEKGDEEQLLGFLNAVFRRTGKDKIVSVEILKHKIFTAEVIGDKTSILDIRAVLADGTKVNIEVQLRNLGNMDKRSLFYWSREYTKGIEAGQDYIELPNVVSINIVNFEFMLAGGFHTIFHLWEDRDRNILLTDALELHFVDMVKFRALPDKNIKNDPLHRWLTYFDKDSPPELIEEVVKMDIAIQKAQERTAFVAGDKEALREYHLREMALSDWTSGVNHALREERKTIARNLKVIGVSIEQIAQGTGLTKEQINEL